MILVFSNPKLTSDGTQYEFTATIGSHYYNDCSIINLAIVYSKDYTDRFTFPDAEDRVAFVDFTDKGYNYSCNYVTTEGNGKSLTIKVPAILESKEYGLPVVYLRCDGNIAPDCPCGHDKLIDCMPLVDWAKIYTKGLLVLGTPNCNCDIPQLFIDYVITYYGIKTLFDTQQYGKMFELYKTLFNPVVGVLSKTCGCHA